MLKASETWNTLQKCPIHSLSSLSAIALRLHEYGKGVTFLSFTFIITLEWILYLPQPSSHVVAKWYLTPIQKLHLFPCRSCPSGCLWPQTFHTPATLFARLFFSLVASSPCWNSSNEHGTTEITSRFPNSSEQTHQADHLDIFIYQWFPQSLNYVHTQLYGLNTVAMNNNNKILQMCFHSLLWRWNRLSWLETQSCRRISCTAKQVSSLVQTLHWRAWMSPPNHKQCTASVV